MNKRVIAGMSLIKGLRFFLGCCVVACLASSCTPKRIVFQSDPAFPAKRDAALRIVLAAPVDSLDLSPARDEVIRAAKDPGKALARVECMWSRGLSDLSGRLAKATELDSDVLSDSPVLPRTSTWIHYESDALSVPRFFVDDSAALSELDARGVDYVVVPQNLSLRTRAQSARGQLARPVSLGPAPEEMFIETPVAILDVHRRAIVWTGVVSSTQYRLSLGSTVLENEAYDWLVDLLVVLGRNVKKSGTQLETRSSRRTVCD
jgi:hypothetical protein